jgi:pyruvate dehydrogenase E1 component alpha subunit
MAETKTKKKRTNKKDTLGGLSTELAIELMRDMLLYRRFEEKAEEGYAIGKIGGFCHVHIGQEAAAAGSIKPLREDDYIISAYREHTQAIAKGVHPNAVMAELYGRADGASGGRGGSMHIYDKSCRFMGGHGIVGAQVPLATGIAWKIKYNAEDTVVIAYMGDAAVNQGAFHESLNLAAIWELPVIYVVENNEYGMGTAFSRVSKTDMAAKPIPHGVPASVVNGQDVLATYAHFRDLIADVRSGGGPRFVDLQTYRFRGHSMSDAVSGTYRPTEEVDRRKEKDDPIAVLRDNLFAGGHLDQAGLEQMDTEARQIAQDATDFAEASPVPAPSSLYEHTWAEINENGRLFFDGGHG